jgi:hypothetical protein
MATGQAETKKGRNASDVDGFYEVIMSQKWGDLLISNCAPATGHTWRISVAFL